MTPKFLLKFWQSLPPGPTRVVCHIGSLLIGLGIALLLHYLLYRVGLPSKPFIYVVF